MAQNRRLISDLDLTEAMERHVNIRVFKDDHIVDSNVTIVRFDETFIVVQSGVSELTYHERETCEFFEMKKRL